MSSVMKTSKSSADLLVSILCILISNLYVAFGHQLRPPTLSAKVRPTELARENATCPDPAIIFPCTCDYSAENTQISLFCQSISSDAQLASIFQQEFPQDNFNVLNIEDSSLEALTPGIFGNKTFTDISIFYSGLQRVDAGALSSSYSTLEVLRFYGNKISQFPFENLPLFTSLFMLELSHNSLTGFPNLVSSSLEYVYLDENSIRSIPVDGFQQLPLLKRILLGSNEITQIIPGTFTRLPYLYIVEIGNNSLTELLTGTVELHEPQAEFFFSNNEISKVEVNAFTGVATQVVANSNSLTTLEEEVWRPTLENNAEILVESNPLVCGCDIAWIIRNTSFISQVYATCSDGTSIQELDPADFALC